ncbi:3-galactosyltransferase 15 [Striga asiatica]|uniref:3-galactosyltransferase 15 n=1 Tax=Striga asiatica TaxID=4170 RepID=A0A5A7PWU9_STRAF|nr:3-galactosyltransferase 15 [Striga asiatica]
MKKWTGGVVILGLALILLISYTFIGKPEPSKKLSAYDFFNPRPAKAENPDPVAKSPEVPETKRPKPEFKNFEGLNELYILRKNVTREEDSALLVWRKMKFLFPRSDALPETGQGIQEAAVMWKDLILMIEKGNKSGVVNKACPHFVTSANNARLLGNESFLDIPCGLVEDSSVTVFGIPDLHRDSFKIELVGSRVEELNPPIVLHYRVILPGENLTKESVMIQNTWTQEFGWGKEEKCPDHGSSDLLPVDGLVKCNTQVIRRTTEDSLTTNHTSNRKFANTSVSSTHESSTFHFVDGNPFTATLWAGKEGFHMTVNGRHETSFSYRERLEPWLVNRVNVRGSLSIVSVLAKGLPVDEDFDLIAKAQELKRAKSIYSNKRLQLLIGVFSSGNNFERRMAIRRTWMQYDAVRSGDVAVCFFIGLHKNKEVNFKLWKEAEAYSDMQLMPFVDYYSLLTYKTIAICILGTKILRAKYIMKMDDDAFVRVDEVLLSLKGKPSNGLLYGHISFESAPHRDKNNKWFISDEEWPHSSYPPWAHGPGYIISQDIARFIVQGHKERDLTLFKLEDVAVGIWINQYETRGQKIEYLNDDRFYDAGCDTDYMLAHYQNPRMMLCLWEKLQKEHKAECCE